jgi:NAD(P)-dependent dehydrogenase (short-subunit alcohol dehydrogenase family)
VVSDPGLRGKTAVITGGASGIGQSIAVALATEGVQVRIFDIASSEETLKTITTGGGSATADFVDLASESQIDEAVARAIGDLGGIDLFVNVAARHVTESVTHLESAAWHEMLEVNVTACVLLCRRIAANMIERGKGTILIVGSTVVCAASYEEAAYRASKTALRSYMETLAIELAPFGIRVNMLTPGPFPTQLARDLPPEHHATAAREVPLGQRQGVLPEVRSPAIFLLSDRLASYITGTELFVDGGLHLRPLYRGPLEEVRKLNE